MKHEQTYVYYICLVLSLFIELLWWETFNFLHVEGRRNATNDGRAHMPKENS